jgi:hypothetical protein
MLEKTERAWILEDGKICISVGRFVMMKRVTGRLFLGSFPILQALATWKKGLGVVGVDR